MAAGTSALVGGVTITDGVIQTAQAKSLVGLGNCDNTSDANKPVSTATQAALDAKQAAATGTPDGTKYLRDDNTWQPVAGGSGLTQPQVLARSFCKC